MYNRYIPREAAYAPVPPPQPQSQSQAPPPQQGGSGGPGGFLGGLLRGEGSGLLDKVNQALSSLLGSVGLKDLDAGDILLALIVLFLILEDGDDLELLIALALMILMNLGER